MTTQKFLRSTIAKLEQAGIGTARLDALVLLEDATGKNRSWLLAHPDFDVKGSTFHTLQQQIKRRLSHEPLAYIRGKTEFYGREFLVNKDVLEPRPESETMLDLLIDCCKAQPCNKAEPCIVDVGTGSGALAITAKVELPQAEVIAIDVDPACLEVARKNAKKHSAQIKFLQGNLLEPLSNLMSGFTYAEPETVFSLSSEVKRTSGTLREQHKGKTDSGPQANSRVASYARKQAAGDTWILLANLPYVPDLYHVNQAAAMEPRHAIFGGEDGLDLYRRLFKQLQQMKIWVQFVFTESLPFQHKSLSIIAKSAGYRLKKTDDFIQLFVADR